MSTSTVTVYTAKEVAEILRCNRETVYRWVRKKELKSCERGGRPLRFLPEHLEEFLHGPKPETNAPAPKPSRSPKYAGTAR